jgi:hypothetical protein
VTAAAEGRAPLLDRHEAARLVRSKTARISRCNAVSSAICARSRAIAGSDSAAIFAASEDADAVLRRVEDAVRRRSETVAVAGKRLGLDPSKIRLEDVALAAGPERPALSAAVAELRAVLAKVAERNRRNAELAKNAAELNAALLRAIFGAEAEEPRYGRNGAAVRETAEPSRFVREV